MTQAPKPQDPTRPLACPHGSPAVARRREDYGPDWWQEWADGCQVCGGEPAGIPYKPGKPWEPKAATEEVPEEEPEETPEEE